MTSQAVLSWTTSSRRFWVRWHRTMRLRLRLRKVRRQVERAERQVLRRLELLQLLERLENPLLLLPSEYLQTPTSEETPLPPEVMEALPPPLTPEELEELANLPMPDPLAEIEQRLGLSTTPPSSQTSPA